MLQNDARVVCKQDFTFRAFLSDQIAIILDIINVCKGMPVFPKQRAIFFQRQHVAVGVHASLIDLVKRN